MEITTSGVKKLVIPSEFRFNSMEGETGSSLVYVTHPDFDDRLFAIPASMDKVKTPNTEIPIEAVCFHMKQGNEAPNLDLGGGSGGSGDGGLGDLFGGLG